MNSVPLNIDWQQILLHAFNFIILAVGLGLLLYNPIRKFMKKREDSYKEAAQKAKDSLEESKRLDGEVEKRKAEIDKEVKEYRSEQIERVNADAGEQLSRANEHAEKLVAEAEEKAARRKEEILAESQREITNMVLLATEKITGTSATPEGDSRLYDGFLSTVNQDNENVEFPSGNTAQGAEESDDDIYDGFLETVQERATDDKDDESRGKDEKE